MVVARNAGSAGLDSSRARCSSTISTELTNVVAGPAGSPPGSVSCPTRFRFALQCPPASGLVIDLLNAERPVNGEGELVIEMPQPLPRPVRERPRRRQLSETRERLMSGAVVRMLHRQVAPMRRPVRIAAAATLEVDGIPIQPHYRRPVTLAVARRSRGVASVLAARPARYSHRTSTARSGRKVGDAGPADRSATGSSPVTAASLPSWTRGTACRRAPNAAETSPAAVRSRSDQAATSARPGKLDERGTSDARTQARPESRNAVRRAIPTQLAGLARPHRCRRCTSPAPPQKARLATDRTSEWAGMPSSAATVRA